MTTTTHERPYTPMAGQHLWVTMTRTPVDVVPDPETNEPILVDGKTDSMTGCEVCDVPLNPDTESTVCPGKDVG